MAKNINDRCPLAVECERKKCEFAHKELDCPYYSVNARQDYFIEDQEELRQKQYREAEEADWEAKLADMDDDEDEPEAPVQTAAPSGLVYLSISSIYPHPDNPRRDAGDVTELADSIKANGILQNLTVIPGHFMSEEEYVRMAVAEGATRSAARVSYTPKDWFEPTGYTVIIGHRRLAAAKKAGLDELPCIIREMTPQEQVKTMLMENIQRSDLTVYEQAQGFQMMLDMGETVESIAKDSGFSQSTVRRRVKLLALDAEKFRKSESRGATLQDYMELDKIDDPELKNKVLDAIGTANFRAELKSAIDADKLKKRMAAWLLDLQAFATEIEKRDYIGEDFHPMDYVRNYGRWSGADATVERPSDLDTVSYYYRIGNNEIDLYRDKQAEPEPTPEELRRKALREKAERKEAELREISERHFSLRSEFIAEFGAAKKHMNEIIWLATDAIIGSGGYERDEVNGDLLAMLLDFEVDDTTDYSDFKAMAQEKAKETSPEYFLLACSYASFDHDSRSYFCRKWNIEKQTYEYLYEPSDQLDMLYDFLKSLGYEMSDEEIAMQNGSHPLLNSAEGE